MTTRDWKASRTVLVLCFGTIAFTGCGQDDDSTAGSAGSAGVGGTAGSGGSAGTGAFSGNAGNAGAGGASSGGTAGSGGTASGGTAGSGGTASGGAAGSSGTGGGSGSAGQIVVAPGFPAWLAYEGAGPFFLCAPGDPEGFLYRGSRNADGTRDGDQQALIDKLAPTGANGIYMMAVRSHGGDGASNENPFVGSDPAQGLSTPILEQWEGWLSSMDAAGIVAYFFFYDDSARIWDTGDAVGGQEQAFIEGLVNRFEHHDHLIWVVAEEYGERYSKQRVSNIAAAIRQADDNDHVIAVHQNHGLSFDFADDPNIDQFAIQYNEPTASALHAGMLNAWSSAAGRYNLNMSEAADHGTGPTARRKNWATAMGGAYVMALGWDIASTPVTDLEDCGRLRAFMESTNFHEMSPHDELARAGTQYVLSGNDSYIAYTTTAGNIGLGQMAAGNYRVCWFDTTSGTQVVETDVPVSDGDNVFSRPAGLGDEIAVHVTRQ